MDEVAPPRASRRKPLLIAAGVLALAAAATALWWTGAASLPGLSGQSPAAAEVSTDLIPVAFGERCGFVDSNGQMVINPQYESASFFLADSGLAPVMMGGKWGLIDRRGTFVVNPQFDGLMPIAQTPLFVAHQGDRAGIVDERGTFVVSPQFDYIGQFDAQGRALAGSGGRHGFIDRRGNFVVPPQFESIMPDFRPDGSVVYFGQDVAAAEVGDRWGFIDSRGQWAISPQFADARPFDESGMAAVRIGGGASTVDMNAADAADMAIDNDATPAARPSRSTWGYIDRSGRMAIAPQFDHAGGFAGAELAPVALGELWGYIDRTGRIKINPQYSAAFPFVRASSGWVAVVQVRQGNDAGGQPRWGWGIIDQSGAFRVQPHHESIEGFDRNMRAIVRVGEFSGLMDETGRLVVNPVYSQLHLMPGSDSYLYEKPALAGQGTSEIGWLDRNGRVLATVRGSICGGDGD